MMVGGTLPIPSADSKPPSSHHHTKSSNIPGGSLSSGSKSTAKSSNAVQATSNNFIPSDRNTNGGNSGNNGNNDKVVIINFDDSFKNQFLYAKPILDKYGFKATFFEVCGWIGSFPVNKKSWQDLAALRQDGMDIESHTMTHAHLNALSTAELNYQIGQSKQCFFNHGFTTPIFAYPYSEGSNNMTVVKVVAKNYDLARTDSGYPLTFLHCDGFKNHPQSDCKTYSDNGKRLTFDNRYSIKSWTHRHIDGAYSSEEGVCTDICHSFSNAQMLQRFIANVNSQLQNNKNGVINAIPIVIYHNLVTYSDVSYSKDAADTTVNLFDQEMKYLYDNGFKVLTLSQLGYDTANNVLYLKNETTTTPTSASTTLPASTIS